MATKHRRYKVLPLPSQMFRKPKGSNPEGVAWSTGMRDRFLDRLTPAPVVFNREGYYLDREAGKTWVECEGEAWGYGTPADFRHRLEHSPGNRRLEPHVFAAIGVLIDARIAGKKLSRMYVVEGMARFMQRIRIGGLKSLARLRKFKAKRAADKAQSPPPEEPLCGARIVPPSCPR